MDHSQMCSTLSDEKYFDCLNNYFSFIVYVNEYNNFKTCYYFITDNLVTFLQGHVLSESFYLQLLVQLFHYEVIGKNIYFVSYRPLLLILFTSFCSCFFKLFYQIITYQSYGIIFSKLIK
jgi:hypothetical protein